MLEFAGIYFCYLYHSPIIAKLKSRLQTQIAVSLVLSNSAYLTCTALTKLRKLPSNCYACQVHGISTGNSLRLSKKTFNELTTISTIVNKMVRFFSKQLKIVHANQGVVNRYFQSPFCKLKF